MEKQIAKSIDVLKLKGTILYPTDTVWGIGCDATDEGAIKRVYDIKKRANSKSMIILVDSLEMLQTIITNIPQAIFSLLETTTIPTTIIYENPVGLAKNVVAEDNTVAIRIVQNEFCKELIQRFGKPIVSTSANISNEKTPLSFADIKPTILKNVDYIVNLQQNEISTKSSRILKVEKDGTIQILRD